MKTPNEVQADIWDVIAEYLIEDIDPIDVRDADEEMQDILEDWRDEIASSDTIDKILNEIRNERTAQDKKWGEQNHDRYKWVAILTEETGEVSEAALEAEHDPEWISNYRDELIQVAAVAVAMIECLDRNQ